MEQELTNTDSLLKELGGCGRFQIIFASIAYLPQIAFAFTMLFMSFGAFNPGWRCLDGNGTNTNITIDVTEFTSKGTENNDSAVRYTSEMKCEDFKACKNIQFNPEASTIVTEWELVCDKDWVPFTMMSLQMVGVLIGTLINGFLGDKIGRKKTLYTFVFINIILNCTCIYSDSWKMYMALRFFLGMTCGVIGYTPCMFITEFVPPKWRVRISSLPLWCIGAMMFGTVVILTKDWKQIHMVSTVISFVCLLPVIWVPESLRWLLVRGKNKPALDVARKIAYWNGAEIPKENTIKTVAVHPEDTSSKTSKAVTIFSLFRRNRLRNTIVFGIVFLSVDLMYYATSFGISSLPGNLYTNFFIIFATEMPSNLISSTIPNIFGRRVVCIVAYALQTMCLFAVAAMDFYASGQIRSVGILTLVVIARLCLCVEWYVILVYIAEVYPTVVRITASGYGGLMAAFGAIIAPYLIPSETNQQYISYLIMAGFTLLCCLLVPLLPETKDKPLNDTWEGNRLENEEQKKIIALHETIDNDGTCMKPKSNISLDETLRATPLVHT